jgi:hypothetical protein
VTPWEQCDNVRQTGFCTGTHHAVCMHMTHDAVVAAALLLLLATSVPDPNTKWECWMLAETAPDNGKLELQICSVYQGASRQLCHSRCPSLLLLVVHCRICDSLCG